MAKLLQPALRQVAGGVLATAVAGFGLVAGGVMPAQASADAPEPVTVRYVDPEGTFFAVPAGVNSLRVVAQGGSGGNSTQGVTGGVGANVSANLAVTPGDALMIHGATSGADAGDKGLPASGVAGSGWKPGGTAGGGSAPVAAHTGGGGGGAAAVLVNGVLQ